MTNTAQWGVIALATTPHSQVVIVIDWIMSDFVSKLLTSLRGASGTTNQADGDQRSKRLYWRVALIGGTIIVLYLGFGWIRGTISASRARASAKRAVSESSKELGEIQKELRQTELRIKEQQLLTERQRTQRELEARTTAAKAELDRKQRQEESEKRRADAIAKNEAMLAERRAAVNLAEANKAKRRQDEESASIKKREDEQAARSRAAAEGFAKVKLIPRMLMSRALVSANSKAEIRGQDFEKLLALKNKEDWLQLLNTIERGKYHEFPSVTIIDGAVSTLGNSSFKVLCQTPIKEKEGTARLMGDRFKVLMIKVRDDSSDPVQMEQPRPHPDGLGYYFDWRPKDGDVALFYAPVGTTRDHLQNLNRSFRVECEALYAKNTLGELDDAALNLRREEVRMKIRDSLFEWALKQ